MSSLQVERQLVIHSLIKENQTVRVDELARRLDVSANTIRRDLNMLEKQGVLKRTQGGAVLLNEMHPPVRQPFDLRSRSNLTEKQLIGQYATRFIKPGSTIILDAGTTTQQLANSLRGIEHITVATNSLEVGHSLMAESEVTVILSGGILLGASRSMIGLPAENFFSQIHAEQLFLAARGVSIEKGLTNANMYETPVKQKMIQVAKEVILLVDHDKFGKVALSQFAPLNCVHKLITDSKAPRDMLAYIESLGTEVFIVDE